MADRMRASVPAQPAPIRGSKQFFAATEVGGGRCAGTASLRDLSVAKFSISNRDVASSVAMLSAMGYSVLSPENSDGAISCQQLPAILSPGLFRYVPEVPVERTRDISQVLDTSSYSSTSSLDIALLPDVDSSDLDELIVFFHPSQRPEIQRLEATIDRVVDAPSPQVYIETMVIEVSQEVSRDLGIRYTTANIGSNNLLSLGVLEPGDGDAVSFERNTRRDVDGEAQFLPGTGIEARVRALVAKEQAEILASPSIMTLSNRQAVIQIVDVVQTPLVQSAIGGAGELLISGYTFEPLLLGITLNLRPRVSADRQWVSLEIDATVESEVDENTGEVFAPDPDGGRVQLAEKKGSASRKVKTVARIPDRTPIVIGGLIAGKKEVQEERVPLLGEIPVLGALFGATDREIQKREIVIVMTPYVLAEDAIGVRTRTASANVLDRANKFRIFDGKHQLLASDVYDLAFLEEDADYRAYRERAAYLLRTRPELADNAGLRSFAQGRVPGFRAVVARTLFDVIALSEEDRDRWLRNIELAMSGGERTTLGELVGEGIPEGKVLALDCVAGAGGCTFEANWLEAGEPREDHAFLIATDSDTLDFLRIAATDAAIALNGGYDALGDLGPGDTVRLPLANTIREYAPSTSTLSVARYIDDMVGIVREQVAAAYADIDRYSDPY